MELGLPLPSPVNVPNTLSTNYVSSFIFVRPTVPEENFQRAWKGGEGVRRGTPGGGEI